MLVHCLLASNYLAIDNGFEFSLRPLGVSFTPLCQCLSEETLNAVRLIYLVYMPVDLKYPTQGVNV